MRSDFDSTAREPCGCQVTETRTLPCEMRISIHGHVSWMQNLPSKVSSFLSLNCVGT